jgi:hypothetical protein
MSISSFEGFDQVIFYTPTSALGSLNSTSMSSCIQDLREEALPSNLSDSEKPAIKVEPTTPVSNVEQRHAMSNSPKSAELMSVAKNAPAAAALDFKSNSSKYTKHRKYYFKDGSIKLLVRFQQRIGGRYNADLVQIGNDIYNLHRTVLEHHSAWFRDHFATPANTLLLRWKGHTGLRGDTFFVNHKLRQASFAPPLLVQVDAATGAFMLEDVSGEDLDAFLSVLYPA